MWGVLRKASSSPVVCVSAIGCQVSCLFDKDAVLLSLLLGCRVRFVYPAEALPGLLSRSVNGPLLSGEASPCVVDSGAGNGIVGCTISRAKRRVGVPTSRSTPV